MAIVHI